MATFKAEVQNKRSDGTYNVRIRVTHNRQIRRISTNLYVTQLELTRGLKIKDRQKINKASALEDKCREICDDLGYGVFSMSIDELVDQIKSELKGGGRFKLDIFKYTQEKIKTMKESTAGNYKIMLNCLKRYIGRDHLDIMEINKKFLKGFKAFIESEPSQRNKTKAEGKKGRATSLYLGLFRSIYNMAKDDYNQEDTGIILIPYSPFKKLDIDNIPQSRKRALSIESIQKIIDLPYEDEIKGSQFRRFNLAKDCILMSFGLLGMNSADFYHSLPDKNGIITYNRQKTADRRDDKAEMKVMIEKCISRLIEKYRDPDGKKLFCFYKHYSDASSLNSAINRGLKQIGKIISEDDLEFYAGRHSWATIARSSLVGADKMTVHEALNHVDQKTKVTDIYIDKDYSIYWNVNKKVLSLFDWTNIIYNDSK